MLVKVAHGFGRNANRRQSSLKINLLREINRPGIGDDSARVVAHARRIHVGKDPASRFHAGLDGVGFRGLDAVANYALGQISDLLQTIHRTRTLAKNNAHRRTNHGRDYRLLWIVNVPLHVFREELIDQRVLRSITNHVYARALRGPGRNAARKVHWQDKVSNRSRAFRKASLDCLLGSSAVLNNAECSCYARRCCRNPRTHRCFFECVNEKLFCCLCVSRRQELRQCANHFGRLAQCRYRQVKRQRSKRTHGLVHQVSILIRSKVSGSLTPALNHLACVVGSCVIPAQRINANSNRHGGHQVGRSSGFVSSPCKTLWQRVIRYRLCNRAIDQFVNNRTPSAPGQISQGNRFFRTRPAVIRQRNIA